MKNIKLQAAALVLVLGFGNIYAGDDLKLIVENKAIFVIDKERDITYMSKISSRAKKTLIPEFFIPESCESTENSFLFRSIDGEIISVPKGKLVQFFSMHQNVDSDSEEDFKGWDN